MVVGGESKHLRAGSSQPGLLDPMVKPPKCHGEAREVPDDGPEGAQPVAPEHHLVALHAMMRKSMHNSSALMEKGSADLKAGQPLAICYPHGHAVLGCGC
jgi:hypothetical protein